jgi:hypothetical protein
MNSRGVDMAVAAAEAGLPVAGLLRDAHRDVLLAVQGSADGTLPDEPRIGIFEDNGIVTVYVTTVSSTDDVTRATVGRAVRAALSPYTSLAMFTNVVFLTRRRL